MGGKWQVNDESMNLTLKTITKKVRLGFADEEWKKHFHNVKK